MCKLIEMQKQYRDGLKKPVRIVCVDAGGKCPATGIRAGHVHHIDAHGHCNTGRSCQYDLVEMFPNYDWEIDKPIWVRHVNDGSWFKRHFAGVINGKVIAYDFGQTSHTNDRYARIPSWNFATDIDPNKENQ